MIFLVEYDRRTGHLVEIQAFNNSAQSIAEEKRLSLEINNLQKQIFHEIVLLEAPSEDELRRTHRRYFENLEQLASSSISSQAPVQQRTN